jgi:hypothetical protein
MVCNYLCSPSILADAVQRPRKTGLTGSLPGYFFFRRRDVKCGFWPGVPW